MNENEFALSNASLENQVKLTCSLEEVGGVKRIRMEFRNLSMGPHSMIIETADQHLNYVANEPETARLVAYLTGLIAQM